MAKTRKEIKEWADKMARLIVDIETTKKLDGSIEAIGIEAIGTVTMKDRNTGKLLPSVHVYSGIKQIAEACETPLELLQAEGLEFPIKYQFTHKGVVFFQIEKEVLNEDI